MVERKGRVKAVVAKDRKKDTFMPIIKEYILPESVIFSDEYPSYDDLTRHRNEYDHRASITARACMSWATFIPTPSKDSGR